MNNDIEAAAPLAIMAAVPQELDGLLHAMGDSMKIQRVAMRDFYLGEIAGQPVVVALSRIGKVAAAATTTILIETFKAKALIFAGLAGGIHASVQRGDIVVASRLMQHDLDASPLFNRYEVPLLGRSAFEPDATLSQALHSQACTYVAELARTRTLSHTDTDDNEPSPRVHRGVIATGDVFVSDPMRAADIQQRLPQVLCVEMEGAAMAQVCYEFSVPYAVMRVISDHADDSANVDFAAFLTQKAGRYTCGVLIGLLRQLTAR